MEENIVFVQSVLKVRIKILKNGLAYIYQKHPELDNQSAMKGDQKLWSK